MRRLIRRVTVIDALGNETRYTYNDLDLLSSVERAEGTIENEITDDNFPQVDGKGHITVYEHDLSGKLVSVTDALGQKDIYSYDESGELISQIDRDGNETVYTRDKNGNITGIKYADGNEVRYSYSAINLLKEVQDKIGLTKIESDIVGRTISVTNPDGQRVGYEYGPYDEKTAIVYPDGKRAEYHYDAFRRLIELKDTNAQESINYEYDTIGRLRKRAFPGGASVVYDYYQGGLLKAIMSTDKEGILDKYEYAYNEKGNRTQIKRYRRGHRDVSGTYDYTYDEIGRLAESRRDGTVQNSYSYDAFGNRKTSVSEGIHTTYSYDIVDRLINKKEVSVSDPSTDIIPVITSYSYDNRGNLVEERCGDVLAKSYGFDASGKMVSTRSASNGEAEYLYDALGHRVGIKENGRLIKEVRDLTFTGDNILQRSYENITEDYMFDGNICSVSRNEENIYMLNDELGSPVYLTGTDGRAFSAFDYDDFGKRKSTHYFKKENILYPIAFTGYQEDNVSGLCYAQARYYSPDNGRFISEDIVRGVPTMPDTVNHYLYCLNDPKVNVDKDGAFLHILAGAAAGALTGAVVAGVHSVLTEGKVDWAAVGGAAIGGAVTGAVVAACPAAAPAAVGALGGGTTSLATGILKGESAGQILTETAIGTATGAIGGKLFQGIGATLGKGVSNVATKALGQTAGKIVGEGLTSGLGGGAINVGFSLVNHKIHGQSYGLSDAAKDFKIGAIDGIAGYATHKISSAGFNKLASMAEQTNAGKTINNLANKAANKIGNAYERFANTRAGSLITRGAGAVVKGFATLDSMIDRGAGAAYNKFKGALKGLVRLSGSLISKIGIRDLVSKMCQGENGGTYQDNNVERVKPFFSGDANAAQNEFNSHMREKVWNDSTLSNKEKVEIMRANFDNMTPEQQKNFNVISDERIIKNPDYSDWGEGKGKEYWPDVDWPEFPGLNGESKTNPPRSLVDSKTMEVNIPENLDRIGSPGGNNLGIVENGRHCTLDERSIAYIENPNARNDYSFRGENYKEAIDAIRDFDVNNPEASVDRLNNVIKSNNANNGENTPLFDSKNDLDVGKIKNMQDSYIKFQNSSKDFCNKYGVDSTYGLAGEAKQWVINGEVVCTGGAGQINTPINVSSLERLGIIKNNGGW